jgi:uncharacterized membrane protein YkvA (DUF1232 family)
MWWIKAAIQEYILRSWSLVKMGTTANQRKLFFNLRKAKSKISALDEGDMHPDQVKLIVKQLGVTETDVIDMNRRLGGDASLNATIRADGDSSEWQDCLVDESPDQETTLAASEEFDNRRNALADALGVLDVHVLYLASRDPRVPWYAKVLALTVATYALSPIDLIPDFIPVIGYLDDLIIVPLGILLVIRLVPAEVMAKHRALAEAAQDRPVSRVAAAVIVAVWIATIALIARLVWSTSNLRKGPRPLQCCSAGRHVGELGCTALLIF